LQPVVVHAANIHDTKSGILPAREAVWKYPTIERFCADAGYRKSFGEAVRDELRLGVGISGKLKPYEREEIPWWWVVERTRPWLNHSCRLAKDFGIAVDSAVAVVGIDAPCQKVICNLINDINLWFDTSAHTPATLKPCS